MRVNFCGECPIFKTGRQGDVYKRQAYISSGTWSLMGVELDRPLINEETRAANFNNEGGVGGTIRFLKNIMGLLIVQQCRQQWIAEGEDVTFRCV